MERREIETLFKNITELAEAKKLYKKLAKQLHPDVGGDEESFKSLNAVYNHILEHGLYFSSEIEFDIEIEKIISQVLHYENIEIEVVGKWIWISGDTKEIKETLKNLGFKWASKKLMWYYGELLKCRNRKEKSIEEIRATYGTQKVQTKKSERIAA